MRVNPATSASNYVTEKTNSILSLQGTIVADKIKRSGAVLTGLDLESYEMCIRGTPSAMDVQRLRDLLARIGR